MRKKQNNQLNLFETPEVSLENTIWEEFKAIVVKLKSKGFHSIDENWWRSRYYEEIICPGHSKNKKGFQFEQMATQCWKFIWSNNKETMIKL